ncbi:MAG: HAD family phosphatase [Acidobacteria bacterium]|nr:HAD family phosphatase [Acidobacteriota bacterium]
MTRALLFDLGNVLIAFDFTRGYRALEGVCPHPAQEIPLRIAASNLVPPYERGEVSSEEFYRQLCEVLDLRVSYEQFCDLWSTIFLPDPIVSEDLLTSLHRRYRMVLISNTNDIHFRMIQSHYPLIRHFDALILSHQVGAMKPADRIYQEAIRQARCRPEECFYTDDIPEFVEGGRRNGLDAVQFTGQVALERELQRRGIPVQ